MEVFLNDINWLTTEIKLLNPCDEYVKIKKETFFSTQNSLKMSLERDISVFKG